MTTQRVRLISFLALVLLAMGSNHCWSVQAFSTTTVHRHQYCPTGTRTIKATTSGLSASKAPDESASPSASVSASASASPLSLLHDQHDQHDQHYRHDQHQDRRSLITSTMMNGVALLGFFMVGNPSQSVASYINPATDPPVITKKVYFDVQWSTANPRKPQESGRIVMGLYGEVMPKVVDNMVQLCQRGKYAGTTFYRVVSEFSIQGGAIGDTSGFGKTGRSAFGGDGNNGNGDGNENNGDATSTTETSSSTTTTTTATTFEPDNFNVQHTQLGEVSMVRNPNGSVDSRFFIQTKADSGWADDRYAAFGQVLEGLELVKAIEKVDVQPPKNNPKNEVSIVACGVL